MSSATATRRARLLSDLLPVVLSALVASAVPVHAAKGDCSQPASTGSGPAASDCLYILRVAVGSLTCTPGCICAPTGSLPTKSSDALLCLRKSVGQNVTLNCPCSLPDGDDFDDNSKDPARWGADIDFEGSGTLLETSGRLEMRSTSPTGTHYVSRPWIASVMPYDEDWEAQVDTSNLTSPTDDDETSSYGLSVFDADNFDQEVFVEHYKAHDNNGFYAAIFDDGATPGAAENAVESNNGAVRVTFDSASKVLTLYFDPDRTDGYDWTVLATFSVDGDGGGSGNADWGLASPDRFVLAVYGYTEEMPIPAGQLFGDNFAVTGGVAP